MCCASICFVPNAFDSTYVPALALLEPCWPRVGRSRYLDSVLTVWAEHRLSESFLTEPGDWPIPADQEREVGKGRTLDGDPAEPAEG